MSERRDPMSVPMSLLGILHQGPCYGYQLRAEFDRRTGAGWPLNAGQIYATLDRLERDGFVEADAADEAGHIYYRITPSGSAALEDWLLSPVERPLATRDEVVIKIALAAGLPETDALAVISVQRIETLAGIVALEGSRRPVGDSPEELARELITSARIATAEAELRWLDHAEQQVREHPRAAQGLALSDIPPKRGRPSKVAGPA